MQVRGRSTAPGVFATFPAEDDLDPYAAGLAGQLTRWAPSVPPDQFVAPAPPTPWRSAWVLCRLGPCVSSG
jgi:hypothetical protein